MDSSLFILNNLSCAPVSDILGGQELILPEILALVGRARRVWVPFFSSGTLVNALRNVGKEVSTGREWTDTDPTGCEVLYYGTPTIVNDRELFPEARGGSRWTKDTERAAARDLVRLAQWAGLRRVITGLGTGDISVRERLEDMGGGRLVCWKDFGEFRDYVLVRDL